MSIPHRRINPGSWKTSHDPLHSHPSPSFDDSDSPLDDEQRTQSMRNAQSEHRLAQEKAFGHALDSSQEEEEEEEHRLKEQLYLEEKRRGKERDQREREEQVRLEEELSRQEQARLDHEAFIEQELKREEKVSLDHEAIVQTNRFFNCGSGKRGKSP